MSLFLRTRSPIRIAVVIAPFRLIKECLDPIAQRALIALQSQDVIRALVYDCLRNVLWTALRNELGAQLFLNSRLLKNPI